MSLPSYAFHGSQAFNERFHQMVQAVAEDVSKALGDNLVALILGGGYGRGEGAIIVVDGEERPYNDLDFLLVVDRPSSVDQAAMARIKEKHESILKIHVDFTKPLTIAKLQKWPPWLMWHDFVNGHITSAGDPEILTKHAPECVTGPLAPIEASRLLINRGAGLLWAMRTEQSLEPFEDDDFAKRNYWKCALALGDALLITHGRYNTPYRGRDESFSTLSRTLVDVADLGLDALYRDALEYKFSPHEVTKPFSLEEMGKRWVQVFLHIEERRFKREWRDAQTYAAWNGLREPEEHVPAKWARNLVRSFRLGQYSWRYPLEEVYRRLPLTLENSRPEPWKEESKACLDLWKGVVGLPIAQQ